MSVTAPDGRVYFPCETGSLFIQVMKRVSGLMYPTSLRMDASHVCMMNAETSTSPPSWAHSGLVWMETETGRIFSRKPHQSKRKMSTHTDAHDSE